ncbi:MAG: ABC transporter permease subunit [Desulfurococcales archaeon]|jgi:peptide/nickel transport system permease protein|nr:ABC transporter permease subunit [Desulfurococcales archaeon]
MSSRYSRYVVRRFLGAIIAVFAILTINFFIFRILPGNPIELLFRNPRLTDEQIRALEAQFGLDKPLIDQYFIYLINVFQGNLGLSFFYRQPVTSVLMPRMINSLILVLPSTLAAIALGIVAGLISAWRRGSKTDVSILLIGMSLYSLPTFWLGGIFILLSIYYLHLPVSGMLTYGAVYSSWTDLLIDFLRHFILPFITLTLVMFGEFMIIMRNTLIDVLTEDYVTVAIAKGLSQTKILRDYALRNAMLPTISIIAINLGLVVAGAVLTETVFSWPGVGRLIYDAILNRDYPILQGAFLFITISVVIANLIADLLYGLLDPRVRYG